MQLFRPAVTIGLGASLLLLGLGPVEKSFDAKGFREQSLEEREAVAQAIRQERANLVNDLIQLAATKSEAPTLDKDGFPQEGVWHDAKHLAILLLGDLRALEAVPVLMENIWYKNVESRELPSMIYRYGGEAYPAAKSLSKIGMPAVQPLLARLSVLRETEPERRICTWTLKEILGERLAKVRLEMAVEEVKDDAARANLKAALEQLEPEPQPVGPTAP
ncbi:MAG: hypothetical protein WBD63_12315 [Phycisphaerae bacterium]|nr:hypothetical protein [Phycisphaerae bacterium]